MTWHPSRRVPSQGPKQRSRAILVCACTHCGCAAVVHSRGEVCQECKTGTRCRELSRSRKSPERKDLA